jgi:hypothetical protein
MRFKSDSQRKACFANMNRFSKGRVPNIGESIYVHGDMSVGIFPVNGKVVGTHKNSVEVEFETRDGIVVEELGLEEFDDEVDMKAKQDFESKLYKDWLMEQSTQKLKELAADDAISGGNDKVLKGVLVEKFGDNTKPVDVSDKDLLISVNPEGFVRYASIKNVDIGVWNKAQELTGNCDEDLTFAPCFKRTYEKYLELLEAKGK